MHTPRLIFRTLPLVALTCALIAAPAASAGSETASSRAVTVAASGKASAAGQASVRVRACKSNAYYAQRSVEFRARMSKLESAAAQTLEVKIQVWRKLKEDSKYRRLKISGLDAPTLSKDPAATVYQRDVAIKNVETAAAYRARATFRWRDVATGETLAKRSVWSKPCQQRARLPHLKIRKINSLPVAGMNSVAHTITVANSGRSEAISVPVAVVVDGGTPVYALIASIGPKESEDVTITAPLCTASAYAQIDPLRTLVRLRGAMRTPAAIERCS